MSFATLIGNERVKAALRAALAENRLPHALIFSGPEGVGKKQFALTLAKALNCPQAHGDSCDTCSTCRKIESGDSLDVLLVRPEATAIKIEQIRQMSQWVYYRPFEANVRVFILDPADALTDQAANAMLKTLEEPPETSVLILITAKLSRLLPTIRSRCQIHHFTPLRTEEVERFLRGRFHRPEREIQLLAKLSMGRIGRTLEIDLSVYEEVRREAIELLNLFACNNRVRLMRAAEYLGRRLSREEFEERLDILNMLLDDLLRLTLGIPPESLTNADIAQRLHLLAEQLTVEKIERWITRLEGVRRDLQRNVNRHLALEEVFLTEAAR